MSWSDGLRAMDRGVAWVLRVSVILTFAAILVLVVLAVVMRLLAWVSVTWTDEVIEPLMAYMMFLCAVALWRERGHFTVELIEQMMPESLKRWVHVCIEALALTFAVVFLWQAVPFALGATEESPFLAIPRKYMFAVLPVTAALMTLYSIRDLVGAVRQLVHAGRPVTSIQA
ncbi:MAG TPA: TRAP transporter small permease subunit [Candidatus Baltobacteraceae bacterium]|nr:TRAP transporter small permease subunit [Candidatus Baltobacteraceae bacterium]